MYFQTTTSEWTSKYSYNITMKLAVLQGDWAVGRACRASLIARSQWHRLTRASDGVAALACSPARPVPGQIAQQQLASVAGAAAACLIINGIHRLARLRLVQPLHPACAGRGCSLPPHYKAPLLPTHLPFLPLPRHLSSLVSGYVGAQLLALCCTAFRHHSGLSHYKRSRRSLFRSFVCATSFYMSTRPNVSFSFLAQLARQSVARSLAMLVVRSCSVHRDRSSSVLRRRS